MALFDIKNIVSLKRSNTKAGLDIGSHAVKMVQINSVSDRPVLASLGMRRIEDRSKEAIADLVRDMAQDLKISVKEFNVSICGASVVSRFITLPKMWDDELKGAIRFEAEKLVPFDIKECVMDFQVLKTDAKTKNQEILLVAAKRSLVEERIKMVEDAGFSVGLVDVDNFAVMNSFLVNVAAPGADKALALLNIGSVLTNLSVIKDGNICFARDIAIGGNDFSSAISKGMGIDAVLAEDLKIAPKDKAAEAMGCMKGVLSNLMDEIRLSCSYYENQYGKSVDGFYLSGGSCRLAGLEGALEEAFDSKPDHWDAFNFFEGRFGANVDKDLLEREKDSFAVAVGLALR